MQQTPYDFIFKSMYINAILYIHAFLERLNEGLYFISQKLIALVTLWLSRLFPHLTLSLPLLSYLVLLLDSLLVLVMASRILWEAEQESPPVLRGSAGVGSLSLSRGLYLDDLVLRGLASGDRCCK